MNYFDYTDVSNIFNIVQSKIIIASYDDGTRTNPDYIDPAELELTQVNNLQDSDIANEQLTDSEHTSGQVAAPVVCSKIYTKEYTTKGSQKRVFKVRVLTVEKIEDAVRLIVEFLLNNKQFINYGQCKKFMIVGIVNGGYKSLHSAYYVKSTDTVDSIMEWGCGAAPPI